MNDPIASRTRRHPPYDRVLAARLRDGVEVSHGGCIFLAAGPGAWDLACYWSDNPHSTRGYLCLPPDADPESYTWDVVRGRGVVITVAGYLPAPYIDRIGREIIRAGASMVIAVGDQVGSRTYWPGGAP